MSSQSVISRLVVRVGISVLPVLVALAVIACDGGSDGSAAAPASAERRVPIAALEVASRDLSRVLASSAVVEPQARVRLASRATGMIESVTVEVGDAAAEGDLLARLDLSEEQAELARAQEQENQARRNYERIARLHDNRSVSAAEYERVRMALRVAESERRLWQTRVEFGEIRAPLDAVVTTRHIEPGEGVDAMDVLFELASMETLILRLGVSELDVVHLHAGQSVPIRLDALPDLELEGSIRRIFPMAEDTSRLVTVEVALPDGAAARGVRPGFLARVRLVVDERPGAVVVLASAVGEDGDERYVYVIDGDRLSRRTVRLGPTRGRWTEVVDGLSVGEVVLATNPLEMRDGQPVRIVGWRG